MISWLQAIVYYFFFIRSGHEGLDVFYSAQHHFHLRKGIFRDKSNILFLFEPTLKKLERKTTIDQDFICPKEYSKTLVENLGKMVIFLTKQTVFSKEKKK